MVRSGVLGALLLALGAPAAPPKPGHAPPQRSLQRRTLAITDASFQEVSVVHVAKGVPTTLSFGQAIRRESILLADTSEAFLPPRATDTSIVLIPVRDLAPRAVATLTVTLADGTLVPLLLETRARAVDIAVDVTVELSRKAPLESLPALKASLLQLRGELDECRGDSGAAGVAKLARLLLEQDGKDAQPVLRQDVHRRDKQERLLVEVERAYRLFGHTFLLVTLENRDPSAPWAFGKAELAMDTGRPSMDVPLLAAEMDVPAIASNETGRLVLAFRTPAAPSGGERLTLQLLERNGTRHVRLDGLTL